MYLDLLRVAFVPQKELPLFPAQGCFHQITQLQCKLFKDMNLTKRTPVNVNTETFLVLCCNFSCAQFDSDAFAGLLNWMTAKKKNEDKNECENVLFCTRSEKAIERKGFLKYVRVCDDLTCTWKRALLLQCMRRMLMCENKCCSNKWFTARWAHEFLNHCEQQSRKSGFFVCFHQNSLFRNRFFPAQLLVLALRSTRPRWFRRIRTTVQPTFKFLGQIEQLRQLWHAMTEVPRNLTSSQMLFLLRPWLQTRLVVVCTNSLDPDRLSRWRWDADKPPCKSRKLHDTRDWHSHIDFSRTGTEGKLSKKRTTLWSFIQIKFAHESFEQSHPSLTCQVPESTAWQSSVCSLQSFNTFCVNIRSLSGNVNDIDDNNGFVCANSCNVRLAIGFFVAQSGRFWWAHGSWRNTYVRT